MADNIVIRRGIKLYIDDVEIEANLKSVQSQVRILSNELSKNGIIGSESYTKQEQKIKELNSILAQHRTAIKGVTDEAVASGGSLSKWQAGIAGFMGGLASRAVNLVTGALQGIGSFIESSVEEWDKQAQAEKKLQNALKGRKDIATSLIAQSEKLQSSMNIPHEAIQDQQAFLAAQGRTEAQIKKTIVAAIQMSAVTGKDLPDSVKMLSGSYEGQLRGLNRLDAGIASLTKEQLRNGVAVDIISAKYQGFAETAAKEGLGPVKQLGMVWGEIKENLGGMFATVLLPLAKGFIGVASGIQKMTGASDASIKSLDDERTKVNMLASKLMEANVPLSVRKKIYDELESLAPSIVEGINREAISYDKLRANLASYNDEMINRIVIQRKQVELDKQNEDVATLLEKKQKIENDIRTSMSKAISSAGKPGNSDYNKQLLKTINDETKTIEEKVKILYYAENLYLKKSSGDWWGYYIQLTKATADYNKELTKSNTILDEKEKLKKELGIADRPEKPDAQLAEELKYAKMSAEQLNKIINTTNDDNEKYLASKALPGAEEREKKLKDTKDYLDKVMALYNEAAAQLSVAGRDRDIALEKVAAQKKLDELKGHTQKEEDTRNEIRLASQSKIDEINQKYDQSELNRTLLIEKDKIDIKLKGTKEFDDAYLKMALRLLEIERDKQLNNNLLNAEERKNINDNFLIAKEDAEKKSSENILHHNLSIEESYYKSLIILDEASNNFSYENKKKELDAEYRDKIATAKSAGQSTLEIEAQNKIDKLKLDDDYYKSLTDKEVSHYQTLINVDDANGKFSYENKKKVLEAEFQDAVAAAKRKGQSTTDIEKQNNVDKLKLAQSYYADLASKIQEWGAMATSALGNYDQIKQNQEKRELDAATTVHDTKVALLKKQLNSKLISQADYDTKVAALDADLDKKKRKIDHDQAVRAKEMSVFEAMISIATAIVKSLSPATIWMVPIISALGALQLAAIVSTPVPAYAEGGFTDGNKVYRAGEKGTEYIASNDQVTDPIMGPLIRTLNKQRLGQVSKDVFLKPAMPAFNALKNAAGSASQSPTTIIQPIAPSNVNNDTKELLESSKRLELQNKQLITYLSDPNNRRAYFSRDLLTKFDKETEALRGLAQFKG